LSFRREGGGAEVFGLGVEGRAAAHGFAEVFGEVAQAGVADGEGGLGDVVGAGEEVGGGLFHAELAQELGDGHAHFLRENAAEIELADADEAAQFLERRGLGKPGFEDFADAADAFASHAFLPVAEKFLGGGKEELGDDFEDARLEPEGARGGQHGGLPELLATRDGGGRQGARGGDRGGRGGAHEAFAQERVGGFIVAGEGAQEPVAAALEGDEAVAAAAGAGGLDGLLADAVKDGGAGLDDGLATAGGDAALAGEIQAELDAVRMEAARPIELAGEGKIVGFEAEAEVFVGAEERGPARVDGSPRTGFKSRGIGGSSRRHKMLLGLNLNKGKEIVGR
jgi:hypothetical protein